MVKVNKLSDIHMIVMWTWDNVPWSILQNNKLPKSNESQQSIVVHDTAITFMQI